MDFSQYRRGMRVVFLVLVSSSMAQETTDDDAVVPTISPTSPPQQVFIGTLRPTPSAPETLSITPLDILQPTVSPAPVSTFVKSATCGICAVGDPVLDVPVVVEGVQFMCLGLEAFLRDMDNPLREEFCIFYEQTAAGTCCTSLAPKSSAYDRLSLFFSAVASLLLAMAM